ncbi:MAG: rhomboid family intramembrane serine protease [Candidatus Brevundimonas colombiensis]|uniref:Rhomboid family intramembrane serine protease n=1 Tax=Candidatus Brevundimonas colombiensis TaxID=3121376 RepID=A0AAJ5WZ34_9CAUL|nr:rhomboid family intramembrane serine protease [Brevundimonas sp.]WEK40029.1 MAG: rhomboid family intramembrane serine protease [Brevundimonas sp.]
MFNVPLVALLIAASIPVLYVFQRDLPDMGMSMAFAPADLERGRWSGLLTAMLLHGGWAHAWMNAIGALAFGAPVARLLGNRAGPMVFLLFYVSCGALATLGYGLIHWGSDAPMVGASGAVFGLIGAATRLMGVPRGGGVLALTDRRVVTASLAWMGVNALTGLIGFAPGADGAGIAWEAHAVGFVVGILAIGPLARAFGRRVERAPEKN